MAATLSDQNAVEPAFLRNFAEYVCIRERAKPGGVPKHASCGARECGDRIVPRDLQYLRISQSSVCLELRCDGSREPAIWQPLGCDQSPSGRLGRAQGCARAARNPVLERQDDFRPRAGDRAKARRATRYATQGRHRSFCLFTRLGFVVVETLEAAVIVRGVARNKLRMELSHASWRGRDE
jgi:hypothetical protein